MFVSYCFLCPGYISNGRHTKTLKVHPISVRYSESLFNVSHFLVSLWRCRNPPASLSESSQLDGSGDSIGTLTSISNSCDM